MTNSMIKQAFMLKPGECLSSEMRDKLTDLNLIVKSNKKQDQYIKNLCQLFEITELPSITTELKYWMAGFIEGEGSINVSCKEGKTAEFGIFLDAEFSVTQHVNGVANLVLLMQIFQAGRIRFKSGSNATMVFCIDNRVTLQEKVIPFLKEYSAKFSGTAKKKRLQQFEQLLTWLQEGKHRDFDFFMNQMIHLWQEMRVQISEKTKFEDAEAVYRYIRKFLENKEHP